MRRAARRHGRARPPAAAAIRAAVLNAGTPTAARPAPRLRPTLLRARAPARPAGRRAGAFRRAMGLPAQTSPDAPRSPPAPPAPPRARPWRDRGQRPPDRTLPRREAEHLRQPAG